MRGAPNGKKENGRSPNGLLLLAAILGAALAVLFYRSFVPHQVLFDNDGPLGAIMAQCNRLPGRFLGTWRSIMWIGVEAPSAPPSLTMMLLTIFPPVLYLKIYGPLSLFFVGFSAWVFFRQLEFKPMVCVLGGIAAGLNMSFVSTACWGQGNWNLAMGMTFLALAALSSKSIKQLWAKAILAGLAVGVNIMEGFDVGAIMSVYVGIFVLFQALTEESGITQKALRVIWTEALVVFFAALIAAHTIYNLVGTQIEGIANASQDVETKGKVWDRDTQWSLPKVETLRLVSPGLFGYRMVQYITETNKASSYWGLVGHDPRIDELKSPDPEVRKDVESRVTLNPDDVVSMQSEDPHTRADAADKIVGRLGLFVRHSGTGEYAGVLVGLLALFALANSWRGPATPFSQNERRAVWFWGAAAVISVMVAWGRHGFLYRLLYQVPYFSTIRNPIKFLHPFHLAWLILAGYGLETLQRRYLQTIVKRADFLPDHLQIWWGKAAGFEKKWSLFSALLLAAAVAGFFVLLSCKMRLIEYLVDEKFVVERAERMAGFCISEAAWFVFFLFLSAGVLAGILSGAWSGGRARWAWMFLGAVIILDLGRSDLPWVHYFDYQEKYSRNDVVDFLMTKKPYEQRVVGRLSPRGPGSANNTPDNRGFGQIYDFWFQNDFPFHNIQSLDFAQMPRIPQMDDAYLKNFVLKGTNAETADLRPSARLWELTGTRYLLLGKRMVAILNENADPIQHGFHLKAALGWHKKEGVVTAEDAGDLTVERTELSDPKGTSGLIEFDHVLPRAKLFANWQTPSDGAATLATLLSTNFHPAQTVLLWTNTPVEQAPGDVNADAGTVEITDYQPRYIKLSAEAKTPAVLLLNDKFAPSWSVTVDKKAAPLLRCNYIMRGVFLSPGAHTVEFRYRPKLKTLFVSLSGWAAGLLVAGYLVCGRRRQEGKATAANQKIPDKPVR
jgi:hypothetical protein